jgi:hypothetical protein
MAPPPIGYTADQRSRAARGATAPTVRSRGRWYDISTLRLQGFRHMEGSIGPL